jgi:hypothetical protein
LIYRVYLSGMLEQLNQMNTKLEEIQKSLDIID